MRRQRAHVGRRPDQAAQPDLLGDRRKRLGVDQRVQPHRQLALGRVGEGAVEHLGHDEAEHAVAEELQPLVVDARGAAGAGMRQRVFGERAVAEAVPGERGELVEAGVVEAGLARHVAADAAQSTQWNRREARISVGHFQISSGLAPPAIEKKMMLARPIRFSAGTKPTEKRLSDELSRLSPIMK